MRIFWPLMALYVAIVIGGSFYLNTLETEPTWLQTTIALGAALPVVGILFMMLRYFNETDEYTRLLQLQAFAWGAVITVSAVFIIGFLQMFEALGAIEVFWFGPAFFLSYGLAYKFIGGKECT